MAILSVMMVFAQSMKLLRSSNQVTAATDIARELIENVRANGYALITPGTYDGRLAVPTPPDPTTNFPPAPYPETFRNGERYLVVVEADPAGLPPNTISVKVDVYWSDNGKATLQTYLRP